MPTLSIKGVKIAYEESGEGLPVVFIHGFPLSRRMWTPQISALSGKYRVIALDLRGFGESDKPSGPYSIKDFADDVSSLMLELNAAPSVVVGHSMGGYIAFQLIRRYSKQVQSLILTNTRAEADTEEKRRNRLALMERIRKEGKDRFLEESAARLLSPQNAEKADLVRQVRSFMEGCNEETLIATLKALAERPDNTDLLKKIRVPTLIIAGDQDQIVPVESALFMARTIPQAAISLIKGTGHLSNFENPKEFNNAVDKFLSSLTQE